MVDHDVTYQKVAANPLFMAELTSSAKVRHLLYTTVVKACRSNYSMFQWRCQSGKKHANGYFMIYGEDQHKAGACHVQYLKAWFSEVASTSGIPNQSELHAWAQSGGRPLATSTKCSKRLWWRLS